MNLYELSQNYLAALDFLTDPENEIDQQTAIDTMESLDGELDDKILNVGRVIANIQHHINGIKEAEKRQQTRRKSYERKMEWMTDYLKKEMINTGHIKLSANDISLSLAKLPASVQIDDENLIPDKFWKEKVERVLSKTAIKEAGGCPGARIESSGYRISIK